MDAFLILFSEPATWLALMSLIVIEVVLGIDNLIFIAIVTNKLPEKDRPRARKIGIGGALILRLILLSLIAYIIGLTKPVISFGGVALSWRDIILIVGGAFLIWKATTEIHHRVDPDPGPDVVNPGKAFTSAGVAIMQILAIDLIFSLDSIITAVGMTPHLVVMVIAVITAVSAMYFAAAPLSAFIERNPTIVMLALAFLLMIGMTLVAEGFGAHVPKGYIYSAMAFSALVEALNMRARDVRKRTSAKVPR